jgi:C1A family cysteine protease
MENVIGNYIRKEPREVNEDLIFKDVKVLDLLPKICDLRQNMPKTIPQQGNIGACVANLVAANIQYLYQNANKGDFIPSRLYIYFIARVFYSGLLPEKDSGTSIEDACKAIVKWGACDEELWPYERFRFFMFPNKKCFDKGKSERNFKYFMVHQKIEDICSVIELGYPVLCSIEIYSSFYSEFINNIGKIPLPDTIQENSFGGHSLLLVGFDLEKQVFWGMNSWGNSWGIDGYCEIDFEYILNDKLASDFWYICLKNIE